MRISTRAGDSGNNGGKSRDHDGSDVETHSESEVGISRKTDIKGVCSEVCNSKAGLELGKVDEDESQFWRETRCLYRQIQDEVGMWHFTHLQPFRHGILVSPRHTVSAGNSWWGG